MASDDLRKIMEALNKAPLKNVPDSAVERDRGVKEVSSKPAEQPRPRPVTIADPFEFGVNPSSDSSPRVALEQVVGGNVTNAPEWPGYLHIETPARELEAEATLVHRRFIPLTGHPDGDPVDRLSHTCKSQRISPEEIVFIDLETTGLSMTPVFLIGTMECDTNGFTFHQYFARNYSEEMSILSAFAQRMQSKKLAITFNGKTFDLPFLANRGIANGVRMPEWSFHLDLLHEARRVYKKDLPNCRLQTLERYICGRERDDDIPGAEIPAAYNEFIRTGNTHKIRSILMHNLYDIFTMADLMCRMWR